MSCGLTEVLSRHLPAGLRKSIKTHTIIIAGVSAQIQTKHLPNSSLQL
jgi:hypothetical protein